MSDQQPPIRYDVGPWEWMQGCYVDRASRRLLGLKRPLVFGGKDFAVIRFLEALGQLSSSPDQRNSLLALRSEFRTVVARRPIAGLIRCLVSGSPAIQPLAIWLLGRVNYGPAIPLLNRYAVHESEQMRIHAVKTLRRMWAWEQLDAIAQADSSPRVRWLAASARRPGSRSAGIASLARTYDTRLSRFVNRSVEPIAVGADQPRSRMAFWSLHPFFAEVRPKSAAFIREFLERIRAAVRGALGQ